MITITLNSEHREVAADTPLATALSDWGYHGEAFAVAINRTFVPRGQFSTKQLQAGDQIDVVAPMQGG